MAPLPLQTIKHRLTPDGRRVIAGPCFLTHDMVEIDIGFSERHGDTPEHWHTIADCVFDYVGRMDLWLRRSARYTDEEGYAIITTRHLPVIPGPAWPMPPGG